MTASKHIAIVCTRLDLPGGIEKAIINTANLLVHKGFRVSLLIADQTAQLFYPLDERVSIIVEPLNFGITEKGNFITRKFELWQHVRRFKKIAGAADFDTVITTEYALSIAAVLAGVHKKSKLLSWEHHHFYELQKSRFWKVLFNHCYAKLHGIVCLNAHEQKLFADLNKHVFVIPNFISRTAEPAALADTQIITIGRLTSVKGTDLLLPVAKAILKNNPGWKWKLIGDGDMRALAADFIMNENLQQQLIIAAPATWDIQNEYRQSSIYVMTSRNECFPMTLLEAMSNGLPCIAFDCDTGPRHIIIENKNGILVTPFNKDEMIAAIQSFIDDKTKRHAAGLAAFESVLSFSPSVIAAQWLAVL